MVKFVGGCLTGVILMVVVQAAGVFLVYQFYMEPMMASLGDAIPPPPLPVSGQETVTGAIRLLDPEGNPVEVIVGGGKTLVVNKWATWCPPCIAEKPSLAGLAARADELGIRVLCVSDESVQTLKAWRDEQESAPPVYHLQEMPMEMGEAGIPETWIIGPTGVVMFKHSGMANWAHESVIEFLRSVSGAAPTQRAPDPADAEQEPVEEPPQAPLETTAPHV